MGRQVKVFLLIVLAMLVLLGFYTWYSGGQKKKVDFSEALDEVAVEVDGAELLVRDMAVYVAYEEGLVEYYAVIYDEDNPSAFWNAYTNHTFIRTKAKQSVLDMAVHDKIFYEASQKENITLTDGEKKYVSDAVEDFWSDLDEEQKNALGVSREEIAEKMQQIALAEKYQSYLAAFYNKEYETYSFQGEEYQKLLEQHEYKEGDIWKRITFGSVTVEHEGAGAQQKAT